MAYISLIKRRGATLVSIAACMQMLLMPGLALADSVIWAHQASGFTSNGAVVIKSLSGGTYSGTQNPTGAVAKVNQSAVTQPPTVIVQATASLPIKAVGDPCTQTTSGSAPNQTAGEGTAITADRTLLLTCQSGVWAKQSISGTVKQPAISDVNGRRTISTGSSGYGSCGDITGSGVGCRWFTVSGGILWDNYGTASSTALCTLTMDMMCNTGSAAGGWFYVTGIGIIWKFQPSGEYGYQELTWPWAT